MSKFDEILEDKHKLGILIISMILVILLLMIVVLVAKDIIIANKKKEEQKNIQDWMKASTSVLQTGLTNGYYVRVNNSYYPLPKIDEKEFFYFSNTSKNLDSIYISNDNKIPVLDISTSDTNFIYKSDTLPYNYELKNLLISSNYSTGIILNDENVVTNFIGGVFDKSYIGYTCQILTSDSLIISDGEVYVTDTSKLKKVAFIKGTLYKEFEIIKGYIKGDIYEPYSNGKQFINLEITKNSYANVLLTEEKYLSTGYYVFNKSDKERYIVKMYNSDESLVKQAIEDKESQLELIKKKKELNDLQLSKKVELDFLIKAGIEFYPVTYTEESKKYEDYKISGIGTKLKLDKDYKFSLKSTQVYGNTRYYLGTITLTSKEKNAVINIAITYDDYISCYDYLDYRINTYVDDKTEKEKIYNSIEDLNKFKGCTYKINENGKEVEKVVE